MIGQGRCGGRTSAEQMMETRSVMKMGFDRAWPCVVYRHEAHPAACEPPEAAAPGSICDINLPLSRKTGEPVKSMFSLLTCCCSYTGTDEQPHKTSKLSPITRGRGDWKGVLVILKTQDNSCLLLSNDGGVMFNIFFTK